MRLRKFIAIGLLAGISAAQATAQDTETTAFRRAVEMPSQRALEKVQRDPETELGPFTTDGCSGGISGGWSIASIRFPSFAEAHMENPPWEDCCVTHDQSYHSAGGDLGAEASFEARLLADNKLMMCVRNSQAERENALYLLYGMSPEDVDFAYDAIAKAMFLSVRFGGSPCSGLPWRWGYGYPGCFFD
ncbi:hypothetical protein C1J03_05750 [Sulfitobacter sp. SK012]|nr:hypothetical protein C1J03_05750 [Sulfitobacter sp. SK012]